MRYLVRFEQSSPDQPGRLTYPHEINVQAVCSEDSIVQAVKPENMKKAIQTGYEFKSRNGELGVQRKRKFLLQIARENNVVAYSFLGTYDPAPPPVTPEPTITFG